MLNITLLFYAYYMKTHYDIQNYINRLQSCGYSKTEAFCICWDFIKEYSFKELDNYVVCLELEIFKEGSYAV